MLPFSDHVSSESLKRPKTPESSSLSKIPRLSLVTTILLLQIVLLSLTFSLHHHRHFASPSIPLSTTTPAVAAVVSTSSGVVNQCPHGEIYIYNLPSFFSSEIVDSCDELNPWSSRCEVLQNDGFGRSAFGFEGLMPGNLASLWYSTDQFVSEIIFHNRMLNYKCRSLEAASATAFYIPFYAGLAVDKYLWKSYNASVRDLHCDMMLNWVHHQPYWNRSNGWDHFITMGRITWDFRRSKDEDWGSSCIYKPYMRNITRLLIERNPWDYFDVGVPYPTGFHPNSDSDVLMWQDFVRTRNRKTLFCFAGATRAKFKNDFRGILLSQCMSSPESCSVVDCGGTRCSNGTGEVLRVFLESDFCLQPRGDSFTRRSIFDCMIAGSVPVFFWKRTAYYQYEWFLPGEPSSYSVFINRNDVKKKNGTSIKSVLEKFSKDEIRTMREKVIDYIPKFVYARPNKGLETIKDAFEIAVDGVLKRIKEQEGGYKWK